MADKIKFWPIRGTYEQIMKQPYYDGKIYFAYDTDQIILDVNGSKHIMGGGSATGSGIIYANGNEEQIIKVDKDNEEDFHYTMPMSALENSAIEPPIDGLILNSDGRFFRVIEVNSTEHLITMLLLAVSGSGGGGGSQITPDITLTYDTDTINHDFTFIEGKSQYASFIATSEADSIVNLQFSIYASKEAYNNGKGEYLKSFSLQSESGEPCLLNMAQFDAGSQMVLKIVASSPSSIMPEGVTKVLTGITIVPMSIKKYKENDFIDVTMPNSVTGLVLEYVPYGTGLTCTLHASVDNVEIDVNKTLIPANMNNRQAVAIPEQSHGMHTVALWLETELNNETLASDKIEFQAAWVDGESTVPIIWFGDYKKTILQYENAVIPYMVYNPVTESSGIKTSVNFKKNNVIITTQEVQYGTNWLLFDATAFYDIGSNIFTVNCGVTSKDVEFVVNKNGEKNLDLVNTDNLVMNFSSLGRTNSETSAARKTWVSGSYAAEFSNFNWYNNGWRDDEDGEGSYLSIANGAGLTIPFGTIGLNGTQDWTFEMRFRVRNIQKYSTLVASIPLYKYYTSQEAFDIDQARMAEGESPIGMNPDGTELSIQEMNIANGNQDLRGPVYWLAYDQYGNPAMNERNTTRKRTETEEGVAIKYLNNSNYGFCIGTQEAYFRTPSNVTNVRYKEDEIINISFVVSGNKGSQKLYMYLNGILSGAENLNNTNVFDMQNVSFVFNSNYCDFDLYNFRIYRTALTMPEVIHNYISDRRDINLYDENQLTNINDATALSYEKLVDYNEKHPDNPSMPYAIWKINDKDHAGDDRLPFIKKGGTRICDITFVNPWLDKALADGTITEEFYYNHSPSYTATGVTIDVQGTSSQGYPRRNYKTKFKSAKDNWVYTQGSLAGLTLNASQTLADGVTKISKKWHMDNPYCATNKFTWKIDYMESSGSYNTGFANMMGNGIYNKHPLEDLYPDGNFSAYRTSVYGFPVLVFHEYADGTREYIGRYNMNLDKSSNEYYGFEESLEQPYVTLTKDIVDEETGEVTGQETYHPAIADVAECWELRDNQGTWCSWRFPSGHSDFSKTKNGQPDGKLEVLEHFEYRYNNQEDEIDAAIDKTTILSDGKDISNIIGSTGTAMNAWLRTKLSNLERLFIWLDSTDTSKATGAELESPVVYSVDRQVDDSTIDYVVNPGGSITATFNNDTAEYRLQKFKAEFDQHLDRHYCTIYFIMTELLLCYDSRGKNMMIATFGPHKKNGEYIWYPIFYDIDTQLGLNNVGALLWDYNEDATEKQTFSTSTSVLWTNFYKMFKTDILTAYATLRENKLTYQTIEGAYTCNPEVFTESYAMKGKRPIVAIGLDEYVKYISPISTGFYDTTGTIQNGELGDYLYACQGDRKLSRELFIINRLNYMDSKWEAGDYIVENAKQQIYMRVNVNATGTSDIYLDRESCGGVLPATARPEQQLADYPVKYLDAQPAFTITPYLSQYVTTFVDDVRLTTSEAYDPVKYKDGMESYVPDARLSEYKKETKQQEINYIPAGDFLSSLGDLSTQYLDSIGIYHGKRLLDITLGSDAPGYYNDLAGATTGTIWTFGDGIDSTNKKTLLKKVILTGLRNLSSAVDLRGSEKLQEYRALNTKIPYVTFANGCPLTTVHLPSYTAELYLNGNKNLNRILRSTPQVVRVEDGKVIYNDHETYEGLYIEGITDYVLPQDYDFKNPTNLGSQHALEYIEIADDALGYDSYELLRNAVVLKYNSNKNNRGYLKIQMNNIHWSPYTVVPYGEDYDDTVTYYKLNDHSKFEVYTEGQDGWNNNTLNEKIYTYDSTANKNLITNLDMFDLFLTDMEEVKNTAYLNQYRNTNRDAVQSYPTITGEIFINNSDESEDAIIEDELTTKYGVVWPNLKITAAKITESFLGKYIVLEDSGKESEYDIIRYNPALYEGQPITLTSKLNPSKGSTYDFIGWATDPEGINMVFDASGNITTYGQGYTFNAASRTVITLYAIFEDHQFKVTFKNAIDSTSEIANSKDVVIDIKGTTYGKTVSAPSILPTALLDSKNLGLTDIYKFKGYTRLRTNTLVRSQTALKRLLVDLSTMPLSEDVTLYACYMLQSVYDEPTDLKYFTFTETNVSYSETLDSLSQVIPTNASLSGALDESYNVNSGAIIDIAPNVHLSGKISLPTYSPSGLPVIAIGRTFSMARTSGWTNNTVGGKDITHIFWYKTEGKEPMLRYIDSNNFIGAVGQTETGVKLQYIELPDSLRIIGSQAFFWINSLDINLLKLPPNLISIGAQSFQRAFSTSSGDVFEIPSSVVAIADRAFISVPALNNFKFGNSNTPSNLINLGGAEYTNDQYTDKQVFTPASTVPGKMEFYAQSQNQIDKWGKFLTGSAQSVDPLFTGISIDNRYFYYNGNSINQ